METKKKTVYIDCTATKYLQINTGIQRVVRNLIDRKQLLESSLHIKCVPVFSAFGRFWEDKIKPQSIEKASSQGKIRLADLGTKISIQLDKAEEFATSSQSIKVLSTILTNVIRIVRRTIRGTGYFAIKAPFLARVLRTLLFFVFQTRQSPASILANEALQEFPSDLSLVICDATSPVVGKQYR